MQTSPAVHSAVIDHLFAGIATADYAAALAWYERLLGRPPDVVVKADESMWQVAEGSWIYVVADADRAGRALITLMVDDLDRQLAGFRERAVPMGALETVPGRFRRVVIADPEGNRVTFGEALGTA